MSKQNKFNIDINKIVKSNRNINPSDLARSLKVIDELKKNGVNVGPDYRLGSPYSRPERRSVEDRPSGSILHSR